MEIENKKYLGDRKLKNIELDSEITYIGDWAFAHCKNLKTVKIKNARCAFGKQVFLGCDALESVKIGEGKNERLLAALIRSIPDRIRIEEASDQWYSHADRIIADYLKESDDTGFEGLWTYGEEDYEEKQFDPQIYIEERQLEKALICALRLNEEGLEKNMEDLYINYLKKVDIKKLLAFYPAFAAITAGVLKRKGVINGTNITELLKDDAGLSGEVRAIMLRNEGVDDKDFFDFFEA